MLNTELIKYDVTSADIVNLKQKYMSLKVANLNDKASYELCKKSRIEVKSIRVAVEKRRVELKADALEYGRAVDSRAKEITASLVEIESHLQAQQDIIDKEVERRKAEAEAERKRKIDARVEAMAKVGKVISFSEASELSEEGYELMLKVATSEFEQAEAKRLAEAEELAKLRAEREENDRLRAQQEAENAKLRAELEAKEKAELLAAQQKLDEERKAFVAKLKAAEEAKVEAERKEREAQKLEADKQAAIEKAKAEAEAKAQQEIANKKLFARIKADFPTIELAWIEIARLTKLAQKGN